MVITIHGRVFKDEFTTYIKDLLYVLNQKKINLIIQKQYASFLIKKGLIKRNQFPVYSDRYDYPLLVDYHLSLGGDGTLLESVTHICEKEVPMLGVNVGRLGYLAPVSPKEIAQALEELFAGNYIIDQRTMVHLSANTELFPGINFGLNELAILKRDTSSMIIVHSYLNDEFLNSYWADGLLVSTPTGSTGYSLSCGGPVLMPKSNSFIITPVSPHNLNVRPLIISDDATLRFEVESRSKKFLVALDARSISVETSVQLIAKKEKFKANLINLHSINYLSTLRSKLNWGLDIRN